MSNKNTEPFGAFIAGAALALILITIVDGKATRTIVTTLDKRLKDAIEREDYEEAARLRDEINSLKQKIR